MSTSSARQDLKRKAEDVIVDPDTLQKIENAKRPKIDLDASRKYACLKSIVEMYKELLAKAFEGPRATDTGPQQMETDSIQSAVSSECPKYNITVGNHITSIIFTVHNVCRQKVKATETNMIKKTESTSFKIHHKGGDHPVDNKWVIDKWILITKKNKLEYKNFDQGDKENWYGTMGPYLDMFAAYPLRTNELRLGHNNMPITKTEGVHKSFPVSKYGLSGAHHVLLEGTSFPPERRSSIVQSLGPMTAWLCMLRSDGMYRTKYAAAVKRAMSHVPCIDDMIELTKHTRQASEISALTTLIAEILLITTSRQATRMFFPLTIFSHVWEKHENPRQFCDFFSTTGAGGWYTYKKATAESQEFYICGKLKVEKASQIVFHSIFGTYKEDLSILGQITSINRWYTREEMGTCFRQQGSTEHVTKIELPGASTI